MTAFDRRWTCGGIVGERLEKDGAVHMRYMDFDGLASINVK